MAGNYITGAAVLGGELILSLNTGEIINAGRIVGDRGPKGEIGQPGPQGLPGRDGNSMLHGPGVPRPDEGTDGDFFYDTSEAAIYGPKVSGTWGSPVYLKQRGIKATTGQEYDRRMAGGSGAKGRIMVGGGPMMQAPTQNTLGLDRIFDNAQPLLASATPKLIAGDAKGDVFHVLLFAQAANGSWYGEIVATRDENRNTAEVIAWETPMGTTPPVLDFQASIGAGDVLELRMTSDIDLTNVRGKIIYV